jgi:hypothetical protein
LVSGKKPAAIYDRLALAAVIGMLVMLAVATVAQRLFARRAAQQQALRQEHAREATRQWLRAGFSEIEIPVDTGDEGRGQKADVRTPNPEP